jgi:hypothetical protein
MEGEKFQFLMVKCHADARYCLIVIRAGDSVQHGIIVTPCSPLSPQGFGYPYTGGGVPDWGTPGFDGASNLDLTGYEGPSGGTAWQALMTDGITIKHPDPGPHLVYGPDWGKFVGTERSVGTTFSDVRYGGAIAATGPLTSTLTKTSVFSVKGSRGGWMIQGEAVGHIVDIDANRQAGQLQYTAGNVPGVGSSVTYSTVEPSKIYKNGQPINITLHDESAPVTSGGAPITFTDGRFIGVGVKVVGGSKRLLAIAALPDIHGVFVGNCGLFYADPSYRHARFVREFYVECNVGGTRQIPFFVFNESGTRASAIAYRQWARAGVAADGSELISQTVETDVIHVDIGEAGTSCTILVEESEGCAYHSSATSDNFQSQSNEYGGPSSSQVVNITTSIGVYNTPVAIGYDGDIEKRLTMTYSELHNRTSTYNDIRKFYKNSCPENGSALWGPSWIQVDRTDTFDRDDSATLTYAINGVTVATLSYQKDDSHEQDGVKTDVVSAWNSAWQPYSQSASSPDAYMRATLIPNYRGWGPSEWDRSNWSMWVESANSENAVIRFSRQGQQKQDDGSYWGWFGFYVHNVGYFNYVLDTGYQVHTRIGYYALNYWALLAVDLITNKLYYLVLETSETDGAPSVTYQIKCNNDVLYSE